MKTMKQIFALLQMSLSGLPQRLGSSAVTIIGITCVVAVLVAMLSMGVGFRDYQMQKVRDDRALVWRKGVVGSGASALSRDTALVIADLPGVKRDANGKALLAGDVMLGINGRRKVGNVRANLPFVGVTSQYMAVYPEMHLTAGRMFQPGLREIIVGKKRYESIKGLELGDSIRFQGGDWKVVGHFEAGGNMDLTLLTDADTLMSAANRNVYNQLRIVLESPKAFDTLKAAIDTNPTLDVELKREKEVMETQSKQLSTLLDFVSYFIGVVMGIGATLGAVNAMYAVVDERKHEIATLRAIGFRSFPIIVSVVLETLLLALPGALLGVSIAWIGFNGNAISPMGASFTLEVTSRLAMFGIAWALMMGLFGGLFPGIRAARVPVATALRAV